MNNSALILCICCLVIGGDLAFAASGKEPLPDKWWLSFEDPELARLIELALADNLDLKSAWDRLAQAEAVARRVELEWRGG